MADSGLRQNKYGGWFNINEYMNKKIRTSYIDKNTMIKTIREDALGEDKRHKYIVDKNTGITMGQLDYVIENNVPRVEMIRVYDQFQRKGYGTKLMQSLQRDYRNTEIDFGKLTSDGKPFIESIAEITEKRKGEYDFLYKGKIKGGNK